jgi:hypothetical protein
MRIVGSLMVVNEIHIVNAAIPESEDDPPVSGQGYGPETARISL